MPNVCDRFFIQGVLSVASDIDITTETQTQSISPSSQFTVGFTFVPGYQPNATAFGVYVFSAEADQNQQVADAASQRSTVEGVITAAPGGAAQLNTITHSNYNRLLTTLAFTFTPSVPGSGGTRVSGSANATLPNASEVIYYYGLLCIIQAALRY